MLHYPSWDSQGDARYLISNSKDQTIKLWDIRRFSSREGMEASRQAATQQNWDYRWQQVPKKGESRCRTRDRSLIEPWCSGTPLPGGQGGVVFVQLLCRAGVYALGTRTLQTSPSGTPVLGLSPPEFIL